MHIDTYLDHCAQRNLRQSYRRAVRSTLCRVDRHLGGLESLDRATIETWWSELDVGPGARVAYAAHLAGFYRWLTLQGFRNDDPTVGLVRPRTRRGLPRPMCDDDLLRALSAARRPVRTWLLLGALAGLRACEMASLHGEDVRDAVLVVRDGKGGKQRIVPLHPLLGTELPVTAGPLFTGRDGLPLSANTLTARTNRFLHRLGIDGTLHTLRHRYGTELYRESRDLRLVQELLGHASPTTTAGYAAWDQSSAAEVVGRLRLDRSG